MLGFVPLILFMFFGIAVLEDSGYLARVAFWATLNWLFDAAAATIDPSLMTVAAFHSVEASQDGRLVSKKGNGDVPGGWAALRSETFTDLKRKLQDEGVKVVPVVQRTAWTDGARERTINLLTKTKNRTALVERIVQFVQARGFDGNPQGFDGLLLAHIIGDGLRPQR